jgi:DNA primase
VDIFGEEYEVRNGQFKVNCISPKCDDESGNLEISLDKGVFHCWKCDYKGSIRKLLRDLGWKWTLGREDEFVSVAELRKVKKVEKKEEGFKGLPEEYEFLGKDDFSLSYVGQKALRYTLTRMGLDDIKTYQVGYCGFGTYKWRVIVPVYENGKVVYFVSRAFFKDVKPVYKNPGKEECGVGKEEVVFNLDSARKEGRAVICEGVFDAIKVGKEGVAIFGTSLSELQKFKILDAVKKIYVMLDLDAIDKSIHIARSLRVPKIDVSLVKLPSGDPGDWSYHELQKFIFESTPLLHRDIIRLERDLKHNPKN